MDIDYTHFKEKLEKEKAELEESLRGRGKQIGDNGDWVAVPHGNQDENADVSLVASRVEEFETNVAVLTQLEQHHAAVVSALERIDNGTYGFCHIDKKSIPLKRLEANPSATTCLDHEGQ